MIELRGNEARDAINVRNGAKSCNASAPTLLVVSQFQNQRQVERSRNLLCVHLSPFDSAQGDCCVFEAVKVRHYHIVASLGILSLLLDIVGS
jgi:hypothetical protein